MTKKFEVFSNGRSFGIYEAETEQEARDACARDAGYQSEAHMVEQLDRASQLQAIAVPNHRYFKVCPRGFRNEVIYFKVRPDQVAEVEAYFEDYEDKNPDGYATWTDDARAREYGVAVAWEDRAYVGFID